MGFNVTIDSKELDTWLNNTMHREVSKTTTLSLIRQDLLTQTRNEAKKNNVTGKTFNSIQGKSDDKEAVIEGDLSALISMETGRGPGKTPPIDELKRWARLKLGDEDLAYVVAKRIAQRGTKKYRTKGPLQITRVVDYFDNQSLPKYLSKLLKDYTE
jgi:hypothetical protein